MDRLKLSFASGPYDRLEALHDGTVEIEGIELDHIELWPPRLIFDRMAGELAYDVAEFSCSEYVCLIDRGGCPFTALPVFPSRVFRHGFICVNRNGDIRVPQDLDGARVGVPLYTQTAAIWVRGLLESEYGVDLDSIRWVQGAVMEPGAHGSPSASPMRRPPPIEINDSDRSLAELLLDGDIDAIIGTFVDDAVRAHPELVRLFPDYRAIERDYFRRTGVFPMMHLVVIRNDLLETAPWIAASLFEAFETAKDRALATLYEANAQRYMLPWLLNDLDEIDAIFGGDAWAYGLEPNRAALETLVGHMHRQGFIARSIPLEELFPLSGQ